MMGKEQAIDRHFGAAFLCILAAVTMAYGWGYRGVVGHEGGAMVPGALLGLVLCLGSGRLDWHRRAAVAGLFGAVGWAWGGSFSYMEQTMYTVSDSLPDVLYGYAALFLLGGLWAGVGGAVLGLSFRLPRSKLQQFVGPLVAISGAFLATYLYSFFDPETAKAVELISVNRFHDADWFAATTALAVSGLYWLARAKDRPATSVFFWGAVGWWIGYLSLTKFGGLLLAPPYRSEGWSGVLGILVVLVAYLVRQRNRAALMLSLYGIVGGGIAFPLAVFIRHPVRVSWGPFVHWGEKAQWKIAEEAFGFFMGLAIALGVVRLLRNGLAPTEEDEPPKRLDVFSVFVILVALLWVNLRRAPMEWIRQYNLERTGPVLGMMPWVWYTLGGALLTALALYALYLYWKNALAIAPATAFGKGALVLILLLWITVIGAFVQGHSGALNEGQVLVDGSFLVLATVATAMVLALSRKSYGATIPAPAKTPASDPCWRAGAFYWLTWASVPLLLLTFTALSMAMQDGPHPGARKRFGPEAYWRLQQAMLGQWDILYFVKNLAGAGQTTEGLVLARIEINPDHTVVAILSDGQRVENAHYWHHDSSLTFLDWHGRQPDHPDHGSAHMSLRDNHLYVAWPPRGKSKGYYVFKKPQ